MRKTFGVLTLCGGLALAGCTNTSGIAYNPYPAPPPLRAEVIPTPPISEDVMIWQPGHWDWAGSGYLWREGRWVQRAGHGTAWVDGYWNSAGGAWNWVPAHWS